MGLLKISECCNCHLQFAIKAGSTGKYCSIECSYVDRQETYKEYGLVKQSKNIKEYLENPKFCITCANLLTYNKRKNKFCNSSCAATHNNQVRGAKSDEVKAKIRNKLKGRKQTTEEILRKTGANSPKWTGKNQKDLRYTCEFCHSQFHKPQRKRFCSQQCYKNSTLSNKTEFNLYKNQCQFRFNVKNYPDLYDLNLLAIHGWYKPSNRGHNLNGVSKDHIYSIKQGFINNVDPYFISHTINCRLILHTDNQKKE